MQPGPYPQTERETHTHERRAAANKARRYRARFSKMTTVMVDNYDSFTYNVYQYLCELGADVYVARNDKITVEEIKKMNPKNIVISPGKKRVKRETERGRDTP